MELTDEKCPNEWVPQLGVTCNIIGSNSVKLGVEVNNILHEGRVTNVIGVINGTVERDRLVIVGNHLDTQGVFAAGHYLGIAQLLEEARVFGLLRKDGWRPRRTLVFSLWDGEEQGMLGSTEWVEDHMFRLQARAVIYIGTELLSGDNFFPRASPTITNSIRRVSSLIPHYKKNTETLLTAWSSQPGVPRSSEDLPMSLPVIGRSDDAPFVFGAGVPTASISFTHNYNGTELYPAYHTGYDTFQMVEKFLDPGFHVSRMSAQLVASLARMWADRKMLPYSMNELAFNLRVGLDDFAARHETAIQNHNLDLSAPRKAAADFAVTAERFTNWTKSIDRRNPIMARIANDNMMRVEKIFIMPGGIPTRPITIRNLVYSPEGHLFPGLEDAINQKTLDRQAFGLQTALLADVLCQAKDYLLVTPV